MHWYVTGGAGFIGSALVRKLISSGERVTVADKLTYAGHLSSLAPVSGSPLYGFHQIDICDFRALSESLAASQPDAILHLAAESHVDRSITGASDFVATNINGTFNLLETARAYWEGLPGGRKDSFRVLHVSTDEVFGSLGAEGLFDERTPYDPRSPYSASKAASDHLAKAWHHTYGLPLIVSNCSNNYGPFQLPEKLIPLMILNGLDGRELPVYGDGQNVRDWIYVDDHVDALIAAVIKGRMGETYCIGARSERANLDVVHGICDHLDRRQPGAESRRGLIRFVTDRPGHDRRYAIDSAKAETELDWRPSRSFEQGLAETVDWYLANEAWWRPLRKAGHGTERLGIRT